jgi:hypothetical protein
MNTRTYLHTVEKRIAFAMPLLEYDDVLEDLLIHTYTVVVADRIFTKEVEDEEIGRFTSDMLEPQRTTANSVGFVVTLLVTCSKCELVNKIHSSCTLTDLSDF